MTAITTVVAAIVLTVITFAIPFVKLSYAVLTIEYVSLLLLILCLGGYVAFNLFSNKTANQSILSLLAIQNLGIACLIQLVTTIVFYVLNAFLHIEIWIPVVVEVLIYAYAIVGTALVHFFKVRNADYHKRIADTSFMDEYRARLKSLVAINEIDSIKMELADLYDTARGSDPVGNTKTSDSESELLSLLQEIDIAIKSNDEEASRTAIKHSKNTLLERNDLCKIGK